MQGEPIMKRPKFFEDLDRSLAGEPEPIEEVREAVAFEAALLAAQSRAVHVAHEMQLAQARQRASRGGYMGAALGGFLDGLFGGRR